MRKHLEKIRSYHPRVRHNIALVLAIGSASLAMIFWLNTFTKQVTSDEQARAFSEQTTPFTLLGKRIGSLWGEMSASVSGIKNIKKSASESEPSSVESVKQLPPGPETYIQEDSY